MKWRPKKKIQILNKTKSWLFEKINKFDKPLANLIKMRRERPKSVKSETKKREITTNTKEI
jgi:hypothetical protein